MCEDYGVCYLKKKQFTWCNSSLIKVYLCFSLVKKTPPLTGREALIGAVRLVLAAAEHLHGDGVVGPTGDASHEALGVLGTAASVATRWCQRSDEWMCPFGVRPWDIGHCWSHLVHCYSHWTTGFCKRRRWWFRCWKRNTSAVLFVHKKLSFVISRYENNLLNLKVV